jgi:hypothetical protein
VHVEAADGRTDLGCLFALMAWIFPRLALFIV